MKRQRIVIKELKGEFSGFTHRRHRKGKRKKVSEHKLKIENIKTKESKKVIKNI